MNTAMILAAGRGERLKPLTNFNPKALCHIHGIPLIEYHINNLAKAGFKQVIINHAYLGGKIREYLNNGDKFGLNIIYSPEPPGGLETGGGILNAIHLLGDRPFITINADIFTDYDLSSITLPETSKAHLVLVEKPSYSEFGDFGLSNNNLIINNENQYTFSGIACYKPSFFNGCTPGRYSVAPLLRSMANTHQVSGEIHNGVWFDIGSIERLKKARENISIKPIKSS